MLRQADVYLNGVAFHCGGTVAKSNVNIGERETTLPPQGQGESYPLSNVISANRIRGFGPTLMRSAATAQVCEPKSPATSRLGSASILPNPGFPGCPKIIVPPSGGSPSIWATRPHSIDRFFRSKIALLFVTVKGTANGDPNEGAPGENTGSVGHAGPITPTR
jgi:hypothetical protein